MDDDFATPEAVSLLFDLVREGNRLLDAGEDASALAGAVEVIVDVLGIDDASAVEADPIDAAALRERFGLDGGPDAVIARLIEMRALARAEGRFGDADAIRQGLEEAGIGLEDGPDGTRWVRKQG
jgi:cysteinyl-tRNA synthetase